MRFHAGAFRREILHAQGQKSINRHGVKTLTGLTVLLRNGLASHNIFVMLMKIGCLICEQPPDAGGTPTYTRNATCDIGMVVNIALQVFKKRPKAQNSQYMGISSS